MSNMYYTTSGVENEDSSHMKNVESWFIRTSDESFGREEDHDEEGKLQVLKFKQIESRYIISFSNHNYHLMWYHEPHPPQILQ